MLSYQDFLTDAIVFICAAFAIMMMFDFIAILVHSWNQCAKQENNTVLPIFQEKALDKTNDVPKSIDSPKSTDIEVSTFEAKDIQTDSTRLATEEELFTLTLRKLKQLAANYSIPGRTAMTKNLKTAHQLLTPKLLGLVTVAEIQLLSLQE
ncbi:hypothetical protein [Calothrix sp. CCY 0018]|uniref:hypothetical protein n=1 Tax=Calothrix sp. CCY 0018 TaxID=3103864 RepID=UPI0039C709F5